MLMQKLEAKIKLRKTAETEQIDFKQTEIFHILFIPLNDGTLRHGGVFDRHQVVHRFMSE